MEKVNELYINIMSLYKDSISSESKNIIADFFTTNSINSIPDNLLKVMKSCPELISYIFDNHNLNHHYNIKKEDFFNLEETDSLKLFKAFLDENYIENSEYKNTSYIKNALKTIKELSCNIEKGEKIKYEDINQFSEAKGKKKIINNKLYERLKLIALNKEKKYIYYKDKIDKYFQKINEILEVLNLINEYFKEFFPDCQNEDIKKIREVINNIKEGERKKYEEFIYNEYNRCKANFYDNAKRLSEKKKSIIFQDYFKKFRNFLVKGNTKREKKKDIQKSKELIINEIEKKFDNMKNILAEGGIKNLEKEDLKIFLSAIKGKNKEEITKEIDRLIKIFGNNLGEKEKSERSGDWMTLSRKEDIKNIAIAISNFIKNLGVKPGNLSTIIQEIITNLERSDDSATIENSINELKKQEIDLVNEKLPDYINILLKLNEKPESIDFLIKANMEKCQHLRLLVGEMENEFLNANDIEDFEKCVKCVDFKMKLGDENSFKDMSDSEIIKLFKSRIEDIQKEGIVVRFTNYVRNYELIKNIFLDKSQTSKKKIELICKNSEFRIKNEGIFFEGIYFDEDTKKKIKMDSLLELRDRALLTKNVKKVNVDDKENEAKDKDKKDKILEDHYRKFVERVGEIDNIYDLVEDIKMSGYPEKIEIHINIDNHDPKFKGAGLETKSFNDLNLKLISILRELKETQINGYKERPLIRFIYGRQFNLIINALKGKEKEKAKISPFLRFVTNNLIKNEKIKFDYSSENDIYLDTINNCEKYLQEILKKNDLDLEKIYKQSFIKVGEYKGVYIYHCVQLEKSVFQIFKYLTNNTPIAQNILLCNRETSLEELTAFLYRAILCQYNSCFIIGGVDLLESEKSSKLIELINKLYVEDYEKMKSCLIILYTYKGSDILKSLKLIKHIKSFDINNNKIETLQIEEAKIKIISSDQSGVGKSTQIKREIESAKKDYIYFPIGGVFNREDIIERLINLNITQNSAIHLDLYDTDETDLMMEFLFSILVTRFYGKNEHIFYLAKEIEIKIELPNGFIDFIEKFPILDLFEIEKMSIKNLKPLITPNDITSNVQVVANYFKALKDGKLNKDLYFETISDSDIENYSTTNKAKILKQEECQELIFEKIKIVEPNYYQITCFIDILGDLFKKFSRNVYLQAYSLLESNLKLVDIKKIRELAIESFIETTKHFTEGVYTKIVKNQQRTYNFKNNNKAMDELAEYNDYKQISFKDINPSLIFFHEGNGEDFSIITNKKETDEEYIKLCELRNCQNQGEKVLLKDYKNYKSNKEFLDDLKNILNIKNNVSAPNNLRKQESTLSTLSKEQLTDYEEVDEEEEEEEDDFDEEEKKKREEEKEKKELEKEKKELKKIEEEEKKTRDERMPIETITKNYVFTADNFIKMVLILLRIRANIPVIMMGETGCGKTYLIRKLSELLNDGSSERMKILNIHAGINDKDIIEFLEKKVIKPAKIIEKWNQKIEFEKKEGQVVVPKKLWVFFDEINTCKSMGLISEIMCKHTYQGKPLPKCITFIAACNPYRIGKKIKVAGLNVNQAHKELKNLNEKEKDKLKQSSTSLVYTVNPLPHSLLNFVFNFGKLENEDEEKYIEKIIKESMYKIYENNKDRYPNRNENDFNKIHQLAKDLIVISHNYIRKKNDISSVSLREIRRFNIFYEFFFNYLMKKKGIIDKHENKQFDSEDYQFYQESNEYEFQKYSIILSVFVCYYLRITNNEERNELKEKLNKKLQEFDKSFEDFLYLPNKEENFIVNSIELDNGIAKNRALLDNVFSLFVAINNKVPIFIVGKPGCSKSLSVQLINNAMKGKDSSSSLFKEYPKIILNTYQGSTASSSEGVKKVFVKARNVLKGLGPEDLEKNISMIFFDEMGLAEHSPKNPLKVIHSELEYDLNEGYKKVAFVGISNWALDASKMNRGLNLSITEPEEDDIKITAYTIGESYDEILAIENRELYENLGLAYYKYKNDNKIKYDERKIDFHGNRDFYHLIKNVALNIFKKVRIEIEDFDQHMADYFSKISIERNFGGLQIDNETTSIEKFKTILSRYYSNFQLRGRYDILENIEDNISDLKSRYLLIISKPSIGISLLESIVSKLKKEYCYYIGSQFEDDIQSEEYTLKILNKIQFIMENNNILILKNLESVYPALYDLFNQNFTVISKKNYARIACGSSANALCQVNDNFRCIINVDVNQIDKEEAPFLNRFEKHILSYEYLLKQEYKEESKRIYKVLEEMLSNDSYKGINYNLGNIFIGLDEEEIQKIVYESSLKKIQTQNLIYEVIKKISLILPQDIILLQSINGFQTKYQEYSQKIIEEYYKGEHINLRKFLEKMEQTKNVVYTFSNIFDFIEKLDKFENKLLGKISLDNIMHLKISDYKSENEFEKKIDIFFKEEEKKICLIKFKFNEGNFLNYINFFIKNKEKERFNENNKQQNKKAFVFIVYLSRFNSLDLKNKESDINNSKLLKETISLSSEYYQIFIDNLNGSENLTLNDILTKKESELYEKCIDFDKELKKNLYQSLSYMKFNIPFSLGNLNEFTYANKLADFISSDKKLMEVIKNCLKKQLNSEENIISKIFKTELSISPIDIDIISVVKKNLVESYLTKLTALYYKAEQDQFFSTLLSLNELNSKNDDNNKIFEEIINKTKEKYLDQLEIFNGDEPNDNENENKSEKKKYEIIEKPGMNEINIIFGLKLPGVKPMISSVIKKFKNHTNKYRKNEDSLRKEISEDQVEAQKKNYQKEIKKYNNTINKELDKVSNSLSLEKDDYSKKEFFDLFLEDYYTLFIINNVNSIKNYNKDKNNTKEEIDLNSLKKFLKLIIKKRIESNKIFKEKDPSKIVASTLNWILNYSNEIANILEIFSKLIKYSSNLYEQIEEIINQNQIKYEISERSKEYTSIVNLPIFNPLESMLKAASQEKIYIDLINNPKDFSNLLNINRELLFFALKVETSYHLFLKEVYSLQEIISIMDCLNSNKKMTQENIKKIISFYSKESLYIYQDVIDTENENELIKEFNQLYKTLVSLMGKDKSFNKLMSIIFKNEFKKINKETFRSKLLEIIVEKDEFIYNNSQLFKDNDIIFVDNNPGGIINNRKNILEKQNYLYKSINNCQKPYLEETIINIFECKIMNYFNKFSEKKFINDIKGKEKDNKNNNELKKNIANNYKLYYQAIVNLDNDNPNDKPSETLIIFNLSLDVFKECIEYLESFVNNEQKEGNINLYKLYAISYIKIYLSKLIYYVYDEALQQEIPSIKEIVDVINGGGESKFRSVIKIYILKLFYNYSDKNLDKMKSQSSIKDFDFAEELINQEIIKEIICEEKLTKNYKDFPLLKYFVYTEYRKRENFLNELGPEEKYKKKYPLLYKYLNGIKSNSNVMKLKNLQTFNEFNNYMIDYYSFQITREEAKNKRIKDEEVDEKKFKDFLNCWKKINKKATKYKDYEFEPKELSENDKLIYFLNDVNEKGYGMYLAAAYQNFINWQNGFLKYIIKEGVEKSIFNYYIENMNKKVPINEAQLNQILILDNIFKPAYKDFDDLLNTFSRRKIFNKDGTIDYTKYNLYEYDIALIEEELANCLLPGKCLFEEEIDHFVIFKGEGFNRGKSNILQTFCKIYKQQNLDKEKDLIMQYLATRPKDDLKLFFNSIQLIIFYLINNNAENENDEISKIILNSGDYLRIDRLCSDFFDEEGKEIQINKLLGVFLFSEHFCFNELCENLQDEYKNNIEEKLIEKISNKLLEVKNFKDAINDISTKDKGKDKISIKDIDKISIKELGSALRRFISRYLVGKKQQNDINPKSLLLPQLKRVDLWDEKIWNIKYNTFDKIISVLIDEFKLTVGQSLSFYNLIKEEDEKEIIQEEKQKEKEKPTGDKTQIKNKGRKRKGFKN